MANNELNVARIKLSTIQYYLDLIQKDWTLDMLKNIMEFDKAQMKGIVEAREGKTKVNAPATLPIFDVIGSNTWGASFQKIIEKTSEAQIYLLNTWWPIHDFELDSGLLRIDVMGKLEVKHMSDCERIKMDNVEYKLEDVYE